MTVDRAAEAMKGLTDEALAPIVQAGCSQPCDWPACSHWEGCRTAGPNVRAAVLATIDIAEARGREAAAKWHDAQARVFDALSKDHGPNYYGDRIREKRIADDHRSAATAIRALLPATSDAKEVPNG